MRQFFLLSLISLFGQLSAQSLAPTESDTSLLWRISGNGLNEASHLFGTIHMIPSEDYFLPATVKTALNDAERVAFEIDPRDMQDPTALFSLMGSINMLNDTSLSDLLTEAEYDTVANYFKEAGLPFFFFEKMKPLFIASLVGQDLDLAGGGFGSGGGIKSYELELTTMATDAEKEILGLETMEFQLGLFDSIPYGIQAQMLLEAVRADTGEGEDQFSEMVDMYKRQAVAEMANMISEEGSDAGRFEELLLTRRNENWMNPMVEIMQKGKAFFAVGAGHLGNTKGVIALLRQAGYTVEAVY